MADNTQKSIFSGIVNALRGGRKQTSQDTSREVLTGTPMPVTNVPQSLQQNQQAFLNNQYQKVAHEIYTNSLYNDVDRIGAYQDYRAMDLSPEVSAAMDIMTDECIQKGEMGNILTIYSENSRVKNVLKDLFFNRLNVDYNLMLWIREMIKYGDNFLLLEIDQHEGIYDVRELPVQEISREESYNGNLKSSRFKWDIKSMYFEEWQVGHFRMISDATRLPYGRSILEPARKLWKQLQLAEDAMLVYRIIRAPERRVHYIEVGNIDDSDIPQFIERIKRDVKKAPLVDSRTGQVNLKFNPMTLEEDYFIPVRGDKGSRIETLAGAANLGDIEDVEYLQNKLFAALKIPKTYLNYSEALPGGATLSQADLRFSRTINRIQEAVLMELRRIANIHLYFLGFHDDIDNFKLTLTNPSTQQELLKLETMKARMEVFKEMFNAEVTAPVSYTWAMENILGFSKDDIKQILRQKKIERKVFSEIEGAVQEYMETGLFSVLDDKFRNPNFAPGAAPGAEGGGAPGADMGAGGGGGGALDMGGLGGGGAEGLSGGETIPGGDVGGADAGAGETIAEGLLFEGNSFKNETENILLNKNKNLLSATKRMIENIDKKFIKKEEGENKEDDSQEILS